MNPPVKFSEVQVRPVEIHQLNLHNGTTLEWYNIEFINGRFYLAQRTAGGKRIPANFNTITVESPLGTKFQARVMLVNKNGAGVFSDASNVFSLPKTPLPPSRPVAPAAPIIEHMGSMLSVTWSIPQLSFQLLPASWQLELLTLYRSKVIALAGGLYLRAVKLDIM
jgi:hypothetical protein